MRFTTRTAVLAAALSLPLCAALASYALAADPPYPDVPPGVEIGQDSVGKSAGTGSDTPSPTTTTTTPPPKAPPPPPKPPQTQVVPPAPPVSDDDDDDYGGEDDDDDGDD